MFQSFWDFQNGKITEVEWEERLRSGKRSAQSALANRDTAKVLGVMFTALHLRNQLIHGGATWEGALTGRNCAIVRTCSANRCRW